MNDLMSAGLHRLWKRYTIDQAAVRPGHVVLAGVGELHVPELDASLHFLDRLFHRLFFLLGPIARARYLDRQLAPVADGILSALGTSLAAVIDRQRALF